MKENIKLPAKAFTKYELNVYKVFSRLFYNPKPLTNYQNLQLITLLHEDKWEKIKIKKLKFVNKFRRGCENSQPLRN